MARIKAKTAIYQSTQEFEASLDKLGALQLDIESFIANHNKVKADQDKRYKTDLKRKNERLSEMFSACELYVNFHRGELLGDKQGAETKLTNFGFRKSPGVIKTLNSKWTFGKALESLKSAGVTACVTIKESLNKNAVKDNLNEEEMAKHGLRLDFPEEFWAEAKRATETQEKRIK
jgi:phage host-nuclease inhibitor protein Gam